MVPNSTFLPLFIANEFCSRFAHEASTRVTALELLTAVRFALPFVDCEIRYKELLPCVDVSFS